MNYINLHTHKFSNRKGFFELVNQYPIDFDVEIPFYSIGIHPWHCDCARLAQDLIFIESKLKLNSCLAIGECGLDKRIDHPLSLQLEVFEKQLALAELHKKPVIIHCVAAFQELIEVKNRLHITVPLIVHGFSKNEQIANQLLANGFYISFGKYLLKDPQLEMVFKTIPNDQFFLETDTLEEGIESVYQLAAKYKNIELSQLQVLVENNFNKVFNNKKTE